MLGVKFRGMLDSDATRTVTGMRVSDTLKSLGFSLNTLYVVNCIVINGQYCISVGNMINIIIISELQDKLIFRERWK